MGLGTYSTQLASTAMSLIFSLPIVSYQCFPNIPGLTVEMPTMVSNDLLVSLANHTGVRNLPHTAVFT